MLAYVFWHRPRAGVAAGGYEAALAAFHDALAADPPAGFAGSLFARLDRAPWLAGEGDAYEDWYLVEDWTAVGRLEEAARQGARRRPHDAAAAAAGHGAAGVYRRMLGAPRPAGARATWFAKPEGMTYGDLGEALDARLAGHDAGVWQRQMVLGPAPELCLLADRPVDLSPWPATGVVRTPLR